MIQQGKNSKISSKKIKQAQVGMGRATSIFRGRTFSIDCGVRGLHLFVNMPQIWTQESPWAGPALTLLLRVKLL